MVEEELAVRGARAGCIAYKSLPPVELSLDEELEVEEGDR